MRHNKLIDVVGTILLLIGFFFAFLPHAAHLAIGLDDKTSHTKHVIFGMSTVVAALAILIYNNKALKIMSKSK